MKNVVLFETKLRRLPLLPLTYTRSAADLRIGILTVKEKWHTYLGKSVEVLTEDYLQPLYPLSYSFPAYYVDARICPTQALCQVLWSLEPNEGLFYKDELIAAQLTKRPKLENLEQYIKKSSIYSQPLSIATQLYDIIALLSDQIIEDFHLLTQGRESHPIPPNVRVFGEKLFVEDKVSLKDAVFDTSTGPIFVGKGASIEIGAMLQGPCSVGNAAQVHMGAKLRAGTSVGPFCKVGGEVSQSTMFEYSNKSHDGFLGHAVVGSWCNLGAGTCCSNLRNNYGTVKLWNYKNERYEETHQQFCGLFLGDYVKSAINQVFNTGTVVGPFSNVFGAGFPSKHIPAFSWGGAEGLTTFTFQKAMQAAERMKQRRNLPLLEEEKKIFKSVLKQTERFRTLL